MALVTKYAWGFGDGYSSWEQLPTHDYLRAGTYVVSLTVYTDYGAATFTGSVIVTDSTTISAVEFCLRFAVESAQGIEWSECSGDDWVTPADVLSIIDDNDVPRMLIEDANDDYIWEDSTFDRVDYQKPSFVDKFFIDDLRSADFRWLASAVGANEYYLDKNSGGNPGYDEPQAMEIGNLPSPQGVIGTLQAGFWGYGDNDGLGYDTIYVRLPDNTDPDTKALGYVEGIFWTEIECEEWYGEEVSDPGEEESKQEITEYHWYTRPFEPENKGAAGYDDNGYRTAQQFALDVYKDGSLVRPFAQVDEIPENGDITFSGIRVQGRRIMPVFKMAASEVIITGRNWSKIIKPKAGSRDERTMDRQTAELALALPSFFIGRNPINPLLDRASGNTVVGTVGSGIGPDGIDGSAILIPGAGLNLGNAAVAGVYTALFWRSTVAPVSTIPALPALTQIGATYNGWQLMYILGTVCPANLVITQGLVSTIRIYGTDVVRYLTMYYNSMIYDEEPKPFEPGF